MRFISGKTETTVKVGMFGNLMSFSAGMRGCIGWRFALIEMQVVLATLVEKFEFSLASETEILRMPVTLMSPMVKGKLQEGVMMPLMVRSLE
ncbi:hypothetical protein BDY19DRAFT_947657 [Irpex rosettiformis]|uniref:Uncharacterized protein n=1 Tax=Irpex rosettiformis TaxID=378272 RepID=A0ACB8U468_9APHY|nr:hypothetical protein BDY19DRAFT_947657 [Irpex rosettiformis]